MGRFVLAKVKRCVVYFGLFESFLAFLEAKKTEQNTHREKQVWFSICRYLVCVTKCKFIVKNSSLKCWLRFRIFLWPIQK